jgi:Xaa-Pro aminopeptidase
MRRLRSTTTPPDVTRTLPVNGTFTPAQRELYQLVRDAQEAYVRR